MARGIPRPDAHPPGALRDLVFAVHDLYREAGMPSMRVISTSIRQRDDLPDTVSHETVGQLLRGEAVPGWAKVESIVRLLASRTVDQREVEPVVVRFRDLWLAAVADKSGATALERDLEVGQAAGGDGAEGGKPGPADQPMEVGPAGFSKPTLSIPGFAGETTRGRDLLAIEQDATALAVLLSSTSLTPPIAVGLFGEWGSGKTFFMRTLESRIAQMVDSGGSPFCRRVISVWFNAWHYAESNLWASLLHHIFASLHGDRSIPGRLLDEALAKVEGVQEAKADAIAQADAAHRAAGQARAELEAMERRHDAAKSSAAEVRARDVWTAISVDDRLRDRLKNSMADLGLPDVGRSARDLATAASEVRSAVQRGRQLATAGIWWKSPLVLGMLAAAVVAGLLLFVAAVIEGIPPELVVAVGQLAVLGAGAATWLTRQAKLIRTLLEPAERIQREIDARLAELNTAHLQETALAQQELVDSESKLAAARLRVAQAQAREDEAKAELRQLTGVRLLERYLADRVSSGDYRQYLGVVALAHRDLRDLDDHLRAAANDESGGPIERIVLYVDDLDRCPPETVVRVLEAVHLLLALPLFAVVVGVDASWLVRSLRDRHSLLLAGTPESPAEEDAQAQPSDYLDKIFQLTYHLPAMTPDRCAALLQHTAIASQPRPGSASRIVHAWVEPAPDVYEPDLGVTTVNDPYDERMDSPVTDIATGVDALALDPTELSALPIVAPLVGSSPRRAKRFLNIYRVSKARVLLGTDIAHPTENALLVLTALVVGLPMATPAMLMGSPLGDRRSLRTMLTALKPTSEAEARRLNQFLAQDSELLELPMNELARWLPIVNRFAWPVTVGRTGHQAASEVPNPGPDALDTITIWS